MPRTDRFSRQSSLPLVLAMAAFALGSLVQLWLARPFALGGMLLDRELRIAQGSSLPSDLLQVGDRLVGIDPDGDLGVAGQQAVSERRAVALLLSASRGPSVAVSIERQGRLERLELHPVDLGGELPVALRGTWRAERIDGQPVTAEIGMDELRLLVEQAAPRPLTVEVRAGGRVQGPVAIQRIRPDLFGVAWLALTLLAVIGVLLGSARSPRSLAPAEKVRLASLLVGGLAAGAAASALLDGLTPVWVGAWYVALACVWRAIAMLGHLHAMSDDPEGRIRVERAAAALALPLLFAAACPVAVWLAVQPGAAAPVRTLGQLEAAGVAIFAAYLLADAALLARTRAAELRGAFGASLISAVALLIGGAAMVLAPDRVATGSLVAATVLASVAAGWIGELLDSVRAPGLQARRAARAGIESSAVGILRRIDELCTPRGSALAVGSGGEFVLVRGVDRTGAGVAGTGVGRAPAPLADALTMLATEGGMFPRAEGDAELDAFAGLAERIGLAAAIPLRPAAGEAVIDVFLVVLDDADGPLPDPTVLAAELDAADAALLYAELGVLASAELIAEARRRVAQATSARDLGAVPAPEILPPSAPIPPTPPTLQPGTSQRGGSPPPSATSAQLGRWAEWLESRVVTEFPVDDEEALNAQERRALRGLAGSDGAVLLLGEPGVGKEFIARAIHHASERAVERFVCVDCSLLPPAVVELELFGDDDALGLVELVGRGSLLLKSASSLPASVLDGVLSRLDRSGGRLFVAERYRGPDPGVPATVPAAIRRRAEQRTLHLAPLRDRPDDLSRLARWFLHREAMRYDFVAGARSRAAELLPDAEAALRRLDLPGNFRELRAILSSAFLRAESGTIGASDLFATAATQLAPATAAGRTPPLAAAPADDDDGAGDIDRASILDALARSQGNRTLAAQHLGVTRGKLLRQMKKFGIQ